MSETRASGSLILVLGDQLSPGLSSLSRGDKAKDRVLMVEVMAEATYVAHHKKKIALIFSSMRHFAQELCDAGWQVDYVRLDAVDNTGSFRGEVARALSKYNAQRLVVTEPGEWRVLEDMKGWQEAFGVPVTLLEDTRFISTPAEFAGWAKGRKQLRMEYFYREMRRKTKLLMEDDKPTGGKWNYDADNRQPAKADLFMPQPRRFTPDDITRDVLELVGTRFDHHIGELEPFWFAVTRAQAEEVFEHFVQTALADFGAYQDAMLTGEKFLFHAVISIYLNIGLLDPLKLCRRVEQAFLKRKAPLNSAEGFIRQILGWREFVRGLYWLKMPDYLEENALEATASLPEFYWTGQTDMRCLKEAIGQTIEEAYAHHIQRLMITGNFALLAGIDPKQVHEWYLAVYADAFEWVELPNTLGMSQFADGGVLASKPYMSSGNYINKMSDYCASCRYDVKKRVDEDACPFNALYWGFLNRNQKTLQSNPRLRQVYASWSRMDEEQRQALTLRSVELLKRISVNKLI